jgi:hypothetical protein
MLKSLALCMGLAVVASTAQAQDYELYAEVEGWDVFVDNSDQTCLIQRISDAGVVQMGVWQKDPLMVYIGVFTKDATNLRDGAVGDLIIDIDGQLFTGQGVAVTKRITEGYQGGYVLSNDPAFLTDVAKRYVMTVYPNTEAAFQVSLDGTYAAMQSAMECNAAQSS